MKGTLHKTEYGWSVKYGDMQFLPLHPNSIIEISIRSDKKFEHREGDVLEFEMVKEYVDKHSNQVQTYAKLISTSKLNLNKLESKLDDALSNENTRSLTKWMDSKRKDDVDNNLFYYKQVMNPYPSESQSYTSYEKGFVEGYNKAKESTFKEEQVIDFTNWLAKFWMSIWVEDRFLWEYQEEISSNHPCFGYKTSEQLFNLYKYRNHEI